ncbi:MAG: hypothetical protein RLZZ15_3999, partial [Verrucomicrobiota bacterium]
MAAAVRGDEVNFTATDSIAHGEDQFRISAVNSTADIES